MMEWAAGNVFWIVIGVISVAGAFFNYLASANRNKVMKELAEKGLPVPEHLIEKDDDDNPVTSGLVLMCVGIGLAVLLWAMTTSNSYFTGPIADADQRWLPFVGIMPFMIGVALLLSAAFRKPKGKSD